MGAFSVVEEMRWMVLQGFIFNTRIIFMVVRCSHSERQGRNKPDWRKGRILPPPNDVCHISTDKGSRRNASHDLHYYFFPLYFPTLPARTTPNHLHRTDFQMIYIGTWCYSTIIILTDMNNHYNYWVFVYLFPNALNSLKVWRILYSKLIPPYLYQGNVDLGKVIMALWWGII